MSNSEQTVRIEDIIVRLDNDWKEPRSAVHRGESCPFPLRCHIELGPATGVYAPIPAELAEFWKTCSGARLFEDAEYGQWGLVLYSPSEARTSTETFKAERGEDYRLGDLVIGEFLGDSDLLIVRTDASAGDYGTVEVVLPVDPRTDSYKFDEGFASFLERYRVEEGAKYWEPQHGQ